MNFHQHSSTRRARSKRQQRRYGLEVVVYHPWLSRIPGLVLYTFCTCTERSGTKLVVDGFAVDKQGLLSKSMLYVTNPHFDTFLFYREGFLLPNQIGMKFVVAGLVVDKQGLLSKSMLYIMNPLSYFSFLQGRIFLPKQTGYLFLIPQCLGNKS